MKSLVVDTPETAAEGPLHGTLQRYDAQGYSEYPTSRPAEGLTTVARAVATAGTLPSLCALVHSRRRCCMHIRDEAAPSARGVTISTFVLTVLRAGALLEKRA